METVNVEMLSNFKTYEEGEQYNVDKETAEKWVAAELAKVIEDPSEKIGKALEAKINDAISKVADKIKVESKAASLPAQPKDHSDKSIGDFCYLVAKNDKQTLANKYGEKVISVGTDTALVPTPLANQLLQSAGWEDSILSRVKRDVMSSDTKKYPVLNQANVSPANGSSAYFGGVVGAYDSEDDAANDTEPTFTSITLNALKYTMSTRLTLEIRQDSILELGNTLTDLFSRAYQSHMDYMILNGAGTTEPVGLIDHAGTATVARATAGNVTYADLTNMYAKKAAGGNGWFWVFSNSTIGELLNLEDTNGNLVFQPNARDSIANTLFGHPVVISEHASTLGTGGDVMLINGPYCGVFGERMNPEISFSDHYEFLKGQRVYKLEVRNDFRPTHASTLTLADGSTTVGEAIQLDDASS